ncbi:DUF6221 family protein [Streptosporangium sp. NPDC051023]|uniref:DUF6221 family protein n=1 Tax=Streptosporangium sp. NPDC051023 TaxID=3155410 RepID=UPI00344D344A
MTDDLISFLRARFDEDEQVVRVDPGFSQEWHTERARADPHDESRACVRSSQGDVITGDVDVERARHIAHYDPARMLRDVQARQHTLVRCQEEMLSGIPRLVHFAKRTLWEMAQPYADHDDYQEEWKL